MSVTVFGGAGFIGSNLVDELMSQGHEVTVVDDFSEGKIENLSRWKGHPRIEVIRGDIRDPVVCLRACDHRDVVFHLAAMSRIVPSIAEPRLAFDINVMGTTNVLEACRSGGVKRVVYSSTSAVYGNMSSSVESVETDCLNPYSLSKKMGEDLCQLYHRNYGLSTISLRYFNVYGPRHQEEGSYATVIAIFRRQRRLSRPLTITGDGKQRRDFVFVGDVVRANMLASMARDVVGFYNVGSGTNHSIREIAYQVMPADGSIEFTAKREHEANETLANIDFIADALGWRPNVSLEQGMKILDLYEERNSLIVRLK